MIHNMRFPTWAWWLIGAITILAAAILIFSVVLGVRAGQQQVETQRRQQIGIALQRATDFQADGDLRAALAEYQKVLILDADNPVAQEGVQTLLALLGGDAAATPDALAAAEEATATPVVAQTTNNSPIAPTAAATPSAELVAAWENAQRAARAGRWQETLNQLLQIQQSDPAFKPDEMQEMLFNAYVNLALEKDNAEALEEAVALYDKALALRPNAVDVRRERDLIAQYLEVLADAGDDPAATIRRLQMIYAIDPDYRDVEERLHQAHVRYADRLAEDEAWCRAQDEYNAALMIASSPAIVAKRDAAQTQCQLAAAAEMSGAVAGAAMPEASNTVRAAVSTSGGPTIGRILYSAVDPISGRSQVLSLAVGRDETAQVLLQDAAQPALRKDGGRLAFRNLRSDQMGISGYDPGTDLLIRFSTFVEDMLPSWNPQGNQIVFASNREGDRRWRIYTMWAEENNNGRMLTYGESPNWHPTTDQIVYRGCDESGNRCGLWTISADGSNAAQLTATPADDRPVWAPSGAFVAFMSNARDGNFEIYRVDVTSREVTRLTNHPGMDILPAVSPDGRWIAFVSNRDGSWKIYAVPSTGGETYLIAPVVGDISRFFEHGLHWTN